MIARTRALELVSWVTALAACSGGSSSAERDVQDEGTAQDVPGDDGATQDVPQDDGPAQDVQRDGADLVLVGGVVRTMDEALPLATAVVVHDGRITYVGDDEGARSQIGVGTEVVELDGRAVIPGLIDAHNHLLWSGTELLDVDLYAATTVAELLAPVVERAESQPEGWIRGAGWEPPAFEGLLHREQLDEAVPGRLVFLSSADAHSAFVSSAALEAAEIDASTPDPAGGIIERDRDGVPTGILRETAADLVAALLPDYPEAQVDQGLDDALAEATGMGITTIVDPYVEAWMLQGYIRRDQAGTLGMRVFGAVYVDPVDALDYIAEAVDLRDRYQSEHVHVNAVKLFIDGVIESETALLLEPYEDGTNAEALFTDDALHEAIAAADAAGLQLHAHAIGDGAVRQMLDAVDWLAGANGERDRRPLLAHLELIDPADIPRFAALGAYANVQPLWAHPDEYIQELTWPVIGEERSQWLYPIGALYEAGATVVAGSDWSVSSMDVFDAIEVAVTRRDPEDPEGLELTPAQRVTTEQILRAHTIDGARAVFLEDDIGSITVGKWADLVIVDRDPLAVDAADLSDIEVDATYFEGTLVDR